MQLRNLSLIADFYVFSLELSLVVSRFECK
jgi:hypothetical protein